jgi:hypothetical protein
VIKSSTQESDEMQQEIDKPKNRKQRKVIGMKQDRPTKAQKKTKE